MSDVDSGGAAPAASEPVSAPAPEASSEPVVTPPKAVSTEPIPQEPAKTEPKAPESKKEPEKPVSTRDALKNASDKIEKDNKEPAEKAKPAEPKSVERERAPDGKYSPKEGYEPKPEAPKPVVSSAPHAEPPARFSPDAKAAWATTHDSVKAETHRAIKEMESGIEKHRVSAEQWERVKPYDEIAKRFGTDVPTALERYISVDKKLAQDIIGGLDQVARLHGHSLRDIAAHIMGQTPEQTQSQSERKINELQAKVDHLVQQGSTIATTIQQQKTAAITSTVATFAEQHPRFNEIADDIKFFIESGRTDDLGEAYKLAERLNPAPANAAPAAINLEPADQTRKGSKSIAGAPSPGSNPDVFRGPPQSTREILKRAMSQVG